MIAREAEGCLPFALFRAFCGRTPLAIETQTFTLADGGGTEVRRSDYRRIGSDITRGRTYVTDGEVVKPPEPDPPRIQFAADGSKLSA